MAKKFTLKDLQTTFKMEVLSGESKLATTEITVYGLNRAGLELTGFLDQNNPSNRRVILLSSKENRYMDQFDEAEKIAKYQKLMEMNVPGIILTEKFRDVKTVLAAAKNSDFPILAIKGPLTGELMQKIHDYYDNFFAPQTEEHGSLVNVFGIGVLITGPSGIGKSEMVLDLIRSNHLFIGDDRIVVTNKNSTLFGASHPILKNLIEVRGIGIMDLSKTHGYQVVTNETKIDLIVELIPFKENGVDESERIGQTYQTKSILGIEIPYIKIPVSAGRNTSVIVEAAVVQLKLLQSGTIEDSEQLINDRIKKDQGN